jgi:hypothetical protein
VAQSAAGDGAGHGKHKAQVALAHQLKGRKKPRKTFKRKKAMRTGGEEEQTQ